MQSPIEAERAIYTFKGKSMSPTLEEGWRIEVEPADIRLIRLMDVVIFGKVDFTCHRIVGKVKFFGQYYFIHKGDNATVGGIFSEEDFIGKVVGVLDENNRRVDGLETSQDRTKIAKIVCYPYLFMYLVKRWLGAKSTNGLTRFLNRLYWKIFYEY